LRGRANVVVGRGELAEAVWGGRPPGSARVTLQNYVKRLRHVLGPEGYERIVTRPAGYVVVAGAAELDVARFAELAGAGRAAAAAGLWEVASARLGAALGLWRGQPLADVPSPVLAVAEVPRLAEMRLAAVEARVDADLHLGRHREVIAELAGLVAAEPLRERLHELLMLALYRSGQQAAALAAYRQARRQLVDQVGIEPGPGLRELNQQILRGDPALRLPAAGGAGSPAAGQPGAVLAAAGAGQPGADGGGGQAGGGQPGADGGGGRAGGGRAGADGGGQAGAGQPGADGGGGPAGGGQPGADAGGRAGAGRRPRPAMLPAGAGGFAGRHAELAALSAMAALAGPAGPVVITTISGTAGVGKTALAVHWARQHASDFPDGQLYVNLRGFDPSGDPLPPSQALHALLEALGTAPDQIPATPEGRQARYRSLLASQKTLILLDNARDPAQVRPLLPGSAGPLVLITSRSDLAGLVTADGARPLALDVLSPAEARDLLTRRLGPARPGAEPAAADQLTQLCARLPLALAITAARAATRPRFPLAALAAELADTKTRLDALTTGEDATSARAVFSWSYQSLDPPAARMFRLLGTHPGPDITPAAAASLAGHDPAHARRLLADLTRHHLLTEHAPGRYTFHDLLRAYATEQAETTDNADRLEAVHRILDHYLHTAYVGVRLIYPSRGTVTLPPLLPGVTPVRLTSKRQALAWFDAEHHGLTAAVSLAADTGFDVHAWQLPWALATFLDWRGHWPEWAATQRTALAAATRLGDTAALVATRRGTAAVCGRLGDYDQARAHQMACLEIYRQLGDQAGQARLHQDLCWVSQQQGDDEDALSHAEQALIHFQAVCDQAGQAAALNNAGMCHALLGNYQQARACCTHALALFRELQIRDHTEAHTWDSLGYAEHHLGNYAEAARCYSRAYGLFRESGDRLYQAVTLGHLGDTRDAAGDSRQACDAWQQALEILDELHHPDAAQIRSKLRQPCGDSQEALAAAPQQG
jgi:DNA-binding SARP family transcriptional activator/tetratricopeptide (TPR) repeat protein